MKTNRLISVLSALCLLISFFPSVKAAVLPKNAIRSTVFIFAISDDGNQIGRASGVIISSKGDVITNKHVVEDGFGFSTQKLLIVPTSVDENLNSKCSWSPTEYVPSPKFDLALLVAPKKLPCSVDYLAPSNDLPQTGTEISILGYPAIGDGFINEASLSLTVVSGQISGRVNEGGDVTYFKTDAKIISGNSGGPVIDSNNRLVGIAAATTTASTIDEFIGLVVPAKHIGSIYTSTSPATGNLPGDVDQNGWYASSLSEFTSLGQIPTNIPFRPSENATRAEFIELLVKAKGGANGQYINPSFSDVPLNSPYFPFFEEAAQKGWVKGTNDCLGKDSCTAKPNSNINRAEAASLLIRAYGLSKLNEAPVFSDNSTGAWYFESIQISADYCVLKGDTGSDRVRPGDLMNRAEMITMISRISKNLNYNSGCSSSSGTNKKSSTLKAKPEAQTINDPSKNPNNVCKEINAVYNSNIGKCACASGYTLNHTNTACITIDAFCKERNPNAYWDLLRESCVCGQGTEPSSDGKTCVLTCESQFGEGSYRTGTNQCSCYPGYSLNDSKTQCVDRDQYCANKDLNASDYMGKWCLCDYGFKADPTGKICIPADLYEFPSNTEREIH